MTRPYAIVSSALATAIISLLAASIIVSALAPKNEAFNAPSVERPYKASPYNLYRLSPIPPGADWGGS